jgi:hypothetical protein
MSDRSASGSCGSSTRSASAIRLVEFRQSARNAFQSTMTRGRPRVAASASSAVLERLGDFDRRTDRHDEAGRDPFLGADLEPERHEPAHPRVFEHEARTAAEFRLEQHLGALLESPRLEAAVPVEIERLPVVPFAAGACEQFVMEHHEGHDSQWPRGLLGLEPSNVFGAATPSLTSVPAIADVPLLCMPRTRKPSRRAAD